MPSDDVFIYLLVDPRTHFPNYVGKTTWPDRRLLQHIEDDSDTPKTRWIADLLDVGLEPEMVIVERAEEESWPARELAWIGYGKRLGWPLKNVIGNTVPYVAGDLPKPERKAAAMKTAKKIARSPAARSLARSLFRRFARGCR